MVESLSFSVQRAPLAFNLWCTGSKATGLFLSPIPLPPLSTKASAAALNEHCKGFLS